MRPAELNIFQRLVRQWDAVHPYNGAQVLHVAGQPDVEALRAAWYGALADLGLGAVHVRDAGYHYVPLNGDAHLYDVARVPAGVSLSNYMSRELNRPFAPSGELPLRPFVLRDGDTFYMGMIYQHWVADSASIRTVLREWFVRVYDRAAAARRPLRMPADGYWSLFGPSQSKWDVLGQVWSLLRSHLRFRRVRRPRTHGSNDFSMRFALRRMPDDLLADLRRASRRHDATINDLFMATMAEVCHRYLPAKHIPRRRDVALAAIVDLRPRTRADLANVFGLYLGFSNVIVPNHVLGQRDRLIRAVSNQMKLHKRVDAPQASAFWMYTALAIGKCLSPADTFRFYRKHMPLSGGISNVNMNKTWAVKYHPEPILDYIRVSPTGPLVPMVFTPTTLGDDLHLGLTYRSALFSEDTADRMIGEFIDRLSAFARESRTHA